LTNPTIFGILTQNVIVQARSEGEAVRLRDNVAKTDFLHSKVLRRNKMSDKIKTAIVGCGGIVSARMAGYRTIWEKGFKYFDLVAMCDLAEDRARRRADEAAAFQGAKPKVYTDFKDMLDKEPDLTLIDIATDHRSHHVIAVPSLESGKHVIIAKPLGVSMRACRVMVETAQKNGRLLAVAENARRSPSERAINWAVKTGRIGQPRMLFWHEIVERLGTWAWRDFKMEAGGGWVLDGGVHFADLFRYHLGDADEVYAVSKQFEPVRYSNPQAREGAVDVTVEDTTIAIVKFKNGTIIQWSDCRVAREKHYHQRILYGSEGCIEWGEGLRHKGTTVPMNELIQQFMSSLNDEERQRLFPAGITHTFALEIKELGDALLHGATFEVDGVVGLKAEAIPTGIYESSWLGQAVKISQIENCEIENYQKDINDNAGL